MYNKAINLLYTDHMKKINSIYFSILGFCEALKIKPININRNVETNLYFKKNNDDFKMKFIYTNSCVNKSSWQIISSQIKNF